MTAAIVFFVFISAVALGLGRAILLRLTAEFSEFLVEVIFSLGIGLGVLSLLVYVIGWLKGLYFWVLLTVLILLAIITYRQIHYFAQRIVHLRLYPAVWISGLSWGERLVLLLLLAHILINSKMILVPPLDSDTVAHWLAYPRVYARHHRFSLLPVYQYVTWGPPNGMMLSTLAYVLQGETLALLFVFAYGIGALVALYCLGKRVFSHRIGLLAVAIFYGTPLVNRLANSGKVDLQWCFLELLAMYALFVDWWHKPSSSTHLAVAGLLSGFALAVRPFSLASISLLSLVIVYRLIIVERRATPSYWLRYPIFYVGIASLVGGHWLLRNLILTGRPFFSTDTSAVWYTSVADYFRLLWVISFRSVETGAAMAAAVGPAFLGFLPLLSVVPNAHRRLRLWLAYGFAFSIVWYQLVPATRFMVPVIALLSIVVAYVVTHLRDRVLPRFRWVPIVVIIGVLGFNLSADGIGYRYGWSLILGRSTRDEYLTVRLSQLDFMASWPMSCFVNEQLPLTARIALVGSGHPYYLERDIRGTPDPDLVTVTSLQTALLREGATHLLIVGHSVGSDILRSTASAAKYLRVVFRDGDQVLYEVVDIALAGDLGASVDRPCLVSRSTRGAERLADERPYGKTPCL